MLQLSAALERVRAGADIMPRRQLEKVLVAELGDAWANKVTDFEYEPLAAASIGQVCKSLVCGDLTTAAFRPLMICVPHTCPLHGYRGHSMRLRRGCKVYAAASSRRCLPCQMAIGF